MKFIRKSRKSNTNWERRDRPNGSMAWAQSM